MDEFLAEVVSVACENEKVDALYLYGSQAKGTATEQSDWDFAVMFSDFEQDPFERLVRPQILEAAIEKHFKMYNKISVIDVEIVRPPLQYNAISGKKLYDRGVPHVRRVENSIISKIEKDYDKR